MIGRQFINLRRLQDGPWQAFERMIARFLEHGGFQDVAVVGGSGDLGADIVGVKGNQRWVVQAKYRSASKPGREAVNEAYDALWAYDAAVIVVATNTFFSPDAIAASDQIKKLGFDIRRWDQMFFRKHSDSLSEYSAKRKKPRPYQRAAINAIHEVINKGHNRGLITLATGLGKTLVAATFIAEYLDDKPDAKVLVLAHMSDLVRQLDRACWSQFSKFTDTHVWTDGEKPAYSEGVTFATWQSVASAFRGGMPLSGHFDLVVVDECHHAPSESFRTLLTDLTPQFLLGVTATPWRGDGESLRPMFGDPVFTMDVVEGMKRGFLAEVDYRMMLDGIDWDEIRQLSEQGLTVRDLNNRLYVPERDLGMIAAIVEEIEITSQARVLVFCRSIDHAVRLQKFFRQYDIPAGVLHSDLHRSERFKTLSDFRMGKFNVLISIEMLNEGIDIPEVNMIVFARVTHSRRIFLQQLGRGLRLSGTKTHVKVMDFVADIRRIAAGVEINEQAQNCKYVEEVRYPEGDIVTFNNYSQDFFKEYLADIACISDLDEDATLYFPV